VSEKRDVEEGRRDQPGAEAGILPTSPGSAIHMVSAFVARPRLVMGQVALAEKSNEIVAIPALLDMMATEAAVVTFDAMGCQRSIATKIIEK
jgi:hypothetical protein